MKEKFINRLKALWRVLTKRHIILTVLDGCQVKSIMIINRLDVTITDAFIDTSIKLIKEDYEKVKGDRQ